MKFGDHTTPTDVTIPRRYATAAARASALPSPELGHITTRDDALGVHETWNGTAWVGQNAPIAYTPTISGSPAGSSIAANNGVLAGYYSMVAPYLMYLALHFKMGSTTLTTGTPNIAFSMPPGYTADPTLPLQPMGSAYLEIAGIIVYIGTPFLNTDNRVYGYVPALYGGPPPTTIAGVVISTNTPVYTDASSWYRTNAYVIYTGLVRVAQQW
jgi:hypothetical protein